MELLVKDKNSDALQRELKKKIKKQLKKKQWTEWKEIRILCRWTGNLNKERKVIKRNQIETAWLKPCGWNLNSTEGLSGIAEQRKQPGRSGQLNQTEKQKRKEKRQINSWRVLWGTPKLRNMYHVRIRRKREAGVGGGGWEKKNFWRNSDWKLSRLCEKYESTHSKSSNKLSSEISVQLRDKKVVKIPKERILQEKLLTQYKHILPWQIGRCQSETMETGGSWCWKTPVNQKYFCRTILLLF